MTDVNSLQIEIKRDANGRFLAGGGRVGSRDPRVTAIRNHLREKLPEVVNELAKAIKCGDTKLQGIAFKIWFDHSMPKIKGHDYEDMSVAAKAALKEVGKLPIEKQSHKLLQMFYAGDISEYVLDVTSRMLQVAQNIYDEEVTRVMLEREREKK